MKKILVHFFILLMFLVVNFIFIKYSITIKDTSVKKAEYNDCSHVDIKRLVCKGRDLKPSKLRNGRHVGDYGP